jgi:hypothetical protein
VGQRVDDERPRPAIDGRLEGREDPFGQRADGATGHEARLGERLAGEHRVEKQLVAVDSHHPGRELARRGAGAQDLGG